jgi:carboxymethylenebutenolidase
MASYQGLTADVVNFNGHQGYKSEAYYARPTKPGKVGGVLVLHHIIAWDEFIIESTRKIAHHGFAAIAPNLFVRFGDGDPDDVGARARPAGGAYDAEVIGDATGAISYLRSQDNSNGKIGVIGYCSGGRHTYLAACTLPNIDAAVDCWGGNVVVNDPAALTPKRPVAPIDLTTTLTAPLLGIFGNDDMNPSRADVDKTEEVLKKMGKPYEFHRYDGAGHAFFNWHAASYRQQQADDAWKKVFAFFDKHLSTPSTAGKG